MENQALLLSSLATRESERFPAVLSTKENNILTLSLLEILKIRCYDIFKQFLLCSIAVECPIFNLEDFRFLHQGGFYLGNLFVIRKMLFNQFLPQSRGNNSYRYRIYYRPNYQNNHLQRKYADFPLKALSCSRPGHWRLNLYYIYRRYHNSTSNQYTKITFFKFYMLKQFNSFEKITLFDNANE